MINECKQYTPGDSHGGCVGDIKSNLCKGCKFMMSQYEPNVLLSVLEQFDAECTQYKMEAVARLGDITVVLEKGSYEWARELMRRGFVVESEFGYPYFFKDGRLCSKNNVTGGDVEVAEVPVELKMSVRWKVYPGSMSYFHHKNSKAGVAKPESCNSLDVTGFGNTINVAHTGFPVSSEDCARLSDRMDRVDREIERMDGKVDGEMARIDRRLAEIDGKLGI